VSFQAVHQLLAKMGIQTGWRMSSPLRNPKLHKMLELVDGGVDPREAADKAGLKRKTACALLRRWRPNIKWTRKPPKISEEQLRDRYTTRGMSAPDIALEFGCSVTEVYRLMEKFRITRRPPGRRPKQRNGN
jgi:transposase